MGTACGGGRAASTSAATLRGTAITITLINITRFITITATLLDAAIISVIWTYMINNIMGGAIISVIWTYMINNIMGRMMTKMITSISRGQGTSSYADSARRPRVQGGTAAEVTRINGIAMVIVLWLYIMITLPIPDCAIDTRASTHTATIDYATTMNNTTSMTYEMMFTHGRLERRSVVTMKCGMVWDLIGRLVDPVTFASMASPLATPPTSRTIALRVVMIIGVSINGATVREGSMPRVGRGRGPGRSLFVVYASLLTRRASLRRIRDTYCASGIHMTGLMNKARGKIVLLDLGMRSHATSIQLITDHMSSIMMSTCVRAQCKLINAGLKNEIDAYSNTANASDSAHRRE